MSWIWLWLLVSMTAVVLGGTVGVKFIQWWENNSLFDERKWCMWGLSAFVGSSIGCIWSIVMSPLRVGAWWGMIFPIAIALAGISFWVAKKVLHPEWSDNVPRNQSAEMD
jgi:hypothetical protein